MSVKNIYKSFAAILALGISLLACSKVEKAEVNDDRLNKPYCNDPEAINYNWDFPGIPDNTTCFFPLEIFQGTYLFRDTVLDNDFQPVDTTAFNIKLFGLSASKIKIGITGFCQSETLKLTADRFYKAYLDSTVVNVNGFDSKLTGQLMCRVKDTASGFIQKSQTDSNKLTIFFTVATDTGYSYHKGTAIKQ